MTTLPRHEGGVKNPTPSSDAEAARIAGNGSTLQAERYYLLLVADTAKQALHKARVSGSPEVAREAEIAYENALSNIQVFRERAAGDFFVLFRCAQEVLPGRVEELIAPTLQQEVTNLGSALGDIGHRTEALEVVVAAETGGGHHDA
jgi:hypothetical protein